MRGFTATRATCAAASLLLAWIVAPLAHAQGGAPAPLNPIVFVHGGSGSGAQFQSQALRFTSNGYPPSFIRVVEYNSPAIGTILPDVLARIDATIAELQAQTGRPQVELVGHSLGTTVSRQYLSTPARAARVAHYVNADGGGGNALPGGVPTLALAAGGVRRAAQPQIVGARNVTLPDQEHIQAVTSQEAFVEMFRFFTGRDPASPEIVPQAGPFPVSGRAVLFPQNVGAGADTVVLVFEIDPATGQRVDNFFGISFPVAFLPVDATGDFGPFQASPNVQYELTLVRPGADARPHRFFFEPFLRSDNLVRLNTSLPGEGLDGALAPFRSATSSGLVITRNKEFRGNVGVAFDDVISVNGTNVINDVTARCCFVGSPAALFLLDVGVGPDGRPAPDGVSNVRTVPPLMGGFLSGADLVIPADPGSAITIDIVPRGKVGAMRTLRIPNGRSTEQRVTVQLNDFDETLPSILFRQACSANPDCLAAIIAALQQLGG